MTLPALTFECYQLPDSGIWCKRRDNGLRGACVADEAILWQHLQAAQAALGQKPPPSVNIEELVRENERLSKECEQLQRFRDDNRDKYLQSVVTENDSLHVEVQRLQEENERLRANQRKKPGRKPRSDAAGAEDQALAAPEQEQDPLDEDL